MPPRSASLRASSELRRTSGKRWRSSAVSRRATSRVCTCRSTEAGTPGCCEYRPLMTEMDIELVRKATALAAQDGAFLLNVDRWTGALTLASGDETWTVPVVDGRPGEVTAGGKAGAITITASPETWSAILTDPAPPGLADLS